MKKTPVFLLAFALAIVGANASAQQVGGSISNPGAGGGGAPSGPAGGDLTGTYPNPTLAASITSGAHTFNGIQTITGTSLASPAWEASISGDTSSRVSIGMNATDGARLSLGPGNAPRDTFLLRGGAANFQLGTVDAAAPVAQTISVQNVVAGTSNTAGTNLTLAGSRGTGTGVGGSFLFQTAPVGSTGSTQNSLVTALTIGTTQITSAYPVAASAGSATLPAFTSASDTASGMYFRTTGVVNIATAGSVRYEIATNVLRGGSTAVIGFTASNASTSADTAISRSSAGVMAIGTGAQGSVAGSFNAATGILNTLGLDTGHTTATVCADSSTGQLYKGSGTVGICLGTSSARYKSDIAPLNTGLDAIMSLQPKTYRYIKGYGDDGARRQNGFLAEDVAKTLDEIVGVDDEGRPNTIDLVALIPVLVKAVQELNARSVR